MKNAEDEIFERMSQNHRKAYERNTRADWWKAAYLAAVQGPNAAQARTLADEFVEGMERRFGIPGGPP